MNLIKQTFEQCLIASYFVFFLVIFVLGAFTGSLFTKHFLKCSECRYRDLLKKEIEHAQNFIDLMESMCVGEDSLNS